MPTKPRSTGCSQPKKPAKNSARHTRSKSHNLCAEVLAACGQPGDLVWMAAVTRPTPLERTERLASDAVSVMGGRSRLIEAILANLDMPHRFGSYLHGIAVRRYDTLDPVLLPVVEGMWRRFAKGEPDRFARSGALNNVGLALGDQGRHAEAVRVLERAIKLQKGSGAPLGRDWDRELSVKLLNLGRCYFDLGKPWPAAKALREAAALQSRIVEAEDLEAPLLWWSDRAQLWMIYSNLGRALSLMKDSAGAVTAFEAGVALLTESLAIHPERATQTDITVFGNYANHLFLEGKIEEAVALLQRTEVEMRLRQRDTGTPGVGFVGMLINKIGYALYGHTSGHRHLSHKELEELEAEANQVIELCKRMVAVSPGLRNLLTVMEELQSEIGRLLAAKSPDS